MNRCGMCPTKVAPLSRNIKVSVGKLFWEFCSAECFDEWAKNHGRFSVLAAQQVIEEEESRGAR